MSRMTRIAMATTAGLAVLGVVEALLCLAAVAQWRLVQDPGPASLAEALTLVIVVTAALLAAWLAVTTLAALLAHLPGRLGDAADRWAQAWAPSVSRRVAAVLVGAVVGGALAPGTALGDGPAGPSPASSGLAPGFTVASPHRVTGPAASEEGTTVNAGTNSPVGERGPGFALTTPTSTESGAVQAPDVELPPAATPPTPGWIPSRPVQRALPSSGLVTGGGASDRAADVVVHRGDTLWDIARRHLGPGASDAEVAHAWPAWHEANRAVIGDDPDLIRPGQILRPPTPAALAGPSSRASR
ncbi:LysM peptidoglycan-binding domain-containing protein [Pedococcus bigeumensis]|uniref:LysM peptidoglycan-binding domain-containing protein n=1 Tax=Pedococcus bigeumensis TaxID=433644 RepID=A0A502D5G0_9MICO|nr:LysM peptidoglycan-binding domain-containing protein [Pedococcus bigeumensis]TPG19261.1 LysM peptidoglycan-binding domain-containing protein [Pedococcus bigeumensis]